MHYIFFLNNQLIIALFFSSCPSRKGNYTENREKNAKGGHLEMKAFINVDDGSNLTDISPVLTCIKTLSGELFTNLTAV